MDDFFNNKEAALIIEDVSLKVSLTKYTGLVYWISIGAKSYHKNGLYHREDGPAVSYMDGKHYWYLDNIRYTEEEWFSRLTLEQKMNVLFNYGL